MKTINLILTKKEARDLKHILNDMHEIKNHCEIDKCPLSHCWYKKLIKSLSEEKSK